MELADNEFLTPVKIIRYEAYAVVLSRLTVGPIVSRACGKLSVPFSMRVQFSAEPVLLFRLTIVSLVPYNCHVVGSRLDSSLAVVIVKFSTIVAPTEGVTMKPEFRSPKLRYLSKVPSMAFCGDSSPGKSLSPGSVSIAMIASPDDRIEETEGNSTAPPLTSSQVGTGESATSSISKGKMLVADPV